MELLITKTWNEQPVNHDPVRVRLEPLDDQSFQMIVQSPFFDDPRNPGGAPGQPFFGLWEYEGDYYYFINNEITVIDVITTMLC